MKERIDLSKWLPIVCAAAVLVLGGCKGKPAVSPEHIEYTEGLAAMPESSGQSEAESPVSVSESAGSTASSDESESAQGLAQAMLTAVLEYNKERYLAGECPAAGWEILDLAHKGDIVTVYALTIYGEYGFQDDNFVKVSGSGVIPSILTFEVLENEMYQLVDYEMPEDGSGYEDSIRDMFPEALWQQCMVVDEEVRQRVEDMERMCAAAYLESIGRQAAIGEYGDFPHPLLTSQGVSAEVADKVTDQSDRLGFPYWIGNLEQVEDGVRYVYEMSYDRENGVISFRKWRADNEETMEELKFDSLTGRQID